MAGGGALLSRSRTVAQAYAPDWTALEKRFPEIRDMLTYAEKWECVEGHCQESTSHTKFVKSKRPKIRGSHRDSNKR